MPCAFFPLLLCSRPLASWAYLPREFSSHCLLPTGPLTSAGLSSWGPSSVCLHTVPSCRLQALCAATCEDCCCCQCPRGHSSRTLAWVLPQGRAALPQRGVTLFNRRGHGTSKVKDLPRSPRWKVSELAGLLHSGLAPPLSRVAHTMCTLRVSG